MEKFKIEITSVPDREELVAEIWYNEFLICEINQESEFLEIEFYIDNKISFNLYNFLSILEQAKKKLVGD